MSVSMGRQQVKEQLDDLEVKQLYDEYMEMKTLLNYVRRPEAQEAIQRLRSHVLILPTGRGIKRRSRI